MADDEKTRWAIDVMTAWADHGDGSSDFLHQRIDDYAAEHNGYPGLITGLINLNGLLLMGMEMTTGKTPAEILQTIAVTVSNRPTGDAPS